MLNVHIRSKEDVSGKEKVHDEKHGGKGESESECVRERERERERERKEMQQNNFVRVCSRV